MSPFPPARGFRAAHGKSLKCNFHLSPSKQTCARSRSLQRMTRFALHEAEVIYFYLTI